MRQGDFSLLAKNYRYRTGYSKSILKALFRYAEIDPVCANTADIGAGTGKLTQDLIELGFKGVAVEPNDEMLKEGVLHLGRSPFDWAKGSAEETGLGSHLFDWVLMGSSFHWVNPLLALKEFHRILKPGAFFTALWNPRNTNIDEFHLKIESWIHTQFPQIQRVSSGNRDFTQTFLEGGYFKDVIFMEDSYSIEMPIERYIGAWRSVNDIRAQVGEKNFEQIISFITSELRGDKIIVPYKTRAWIAQAV